ncbi:uncharacterized protein LOC108607651 [Drosophila busckii]|uniref:uncharacterized protein LOC108607651 n=1 Tax=Drosophila busckii TaxID=30019 RepID=UPI0014328E0D|nr:uncharacterized protein LOC108607651 [Drosophila busckii]
MTMRCQGAFRQLLRHCQSATLTSGNNYLSRRHTCWTNNYSNNVVSLATGRSYSKFNTHLNNERAMELLCNLDDEERKVLREALSKMNADKEKKQYESENYF